ncbi:hypothetical protein FQR65_LT06943 [Abscondita terminalis]|nr:hypothetical protein FQR65_LT06943 [Abscondita terminalis]
MDCVIPGVNIKILSRITNALSKIGDDVYLETANDYLCLKSFNMTTTAYCVVNLYDTFFTAYDVVPNDERLLCRIPMKGFLSVFKSHGHKDTKPEFCKIELEHNASKIIFRFGYKHDVTVVRSLYLSDGHMVNIIYNKENSINHIGGSAQIFSQVLANFQMHDEDMSMEVTPQKALIRNYIAGENSVTKGIRSQITLTSGEFSSYKINSDTSITFSLKPFRAAVHFAECYGLGILINFEKPGRPALFEIKNPTFDLNFVCATLKSDDATQSSLSSMIHKAAPQNKELNSVNWEDFNEPMDTDVREGSVNNDDEVMPSPESPRSKKLRTVFGRCFDATFKEEAVDLGRELAPDSD